MEKRKFERFELEAPMRVEYTGPGGAKEIVYLKTREISAGGAYLRSGRAIPSGARVNFELILSVPHQKDVIVRLNGAIMRNEPEGMAVSFDHSYSLKAFDTE